MRLLIPLLSLLGPLTGCEEPTVTFDAFVLPQPVDMTRVLGPAPRLLGPQDTLALRLHFDAATGFTDFRLQNDSTMHSWLTARAFRFRGLYYLVENRPDDGYWVHAVRIRRGQVQGLGTSYRQMLALSEATWQGNWPQLLAPNGDSMRLRFDRQQLRTFYATQVANCATYQLVVTPAARPHFVSSPPPVSGLHLSLYPNPASSTATVLLGDAAAYHVQLYNEQGHLVRSYQVSSSQLVVPVAALRNGTYLVRINSAGKRPSTTLRLEVAH